jgi:hypothetical protein
MASRITISAKKKAIMNKFELIPSRKATEVVIADTREAWLEGIPPVRQAIVPNISLPFLLCPLRRTIAAFINWAINQLDTLDKKIGFSKKAFIDSDRATIAKDIILTILQ